MIATKVDEQTVWEAGYRQGWAECEEYLHAIGLLRAPLPPPPPEESDEA